MASFKDVQRSGETIIPLLLSLDKRWVAQEFQVFIYEPSQHCEGFHGEVERFQKHTVLRIHTPFREGVELAVNIAAQFDEIPLFFGYPDEVGRPFFIIFFVLVSDPCQAFSVNNDLSEGVDQLNESHI